MTSDREIADGIMSAHYEFWDDPIEANRRSPKLEAIRDAIAAALASVRPKPTTSDKAAADGIVDEIAQKGVSLDDKQWDFAVGAIAAALASVREEGKWQLIETAPRDGLDTYLVASEGFGDRGEPPWVCEARYFPDEDGWWSAGSHPTDAHDGQVYPTHYRPLPEPPIRSRQTPTGTENRR